MEIDFIGDHGTPNTDTPRELTDNEKADILMLGRLGGIKHHIALTNSTLGAAVRIVDAILKEYVEPLRRN